MMPKLTYLAPIPSGINPGLNGTTNSLMLQLLGKPRSTYSAHCKAVTNPTLKNRMKTQNVGPFSVTGLDRAVGSLGLVMRDIEAEQPEVFAALGTAGMLCCRFVRGSTSSISNHSWGTAIDLTLNGQLDARGNNKVQHGLTLIAPIFNRHKWYWGAGFPTEDGMHFEVSRQLLSEWSGVPASEPTDPLPNPASVTPLTKTLRLGAQGDDVRRLQERLKELGHNVVVDSDFGPGTLKAVLAVQKQLGLVADGVVGPLTWTNLHAR
jgi:Putative peptidoglycan binding domain/D-alanyl-D-alanine carboxypeptidase